MITRLTGRLMDEPCWVVALVGSTGKSVAVIKKLALKNGWDGVSEVLSLNGVVLCFWDILRHKPTITTAHGKYTARQFSGKTRDTGMVFVKGHVMPLIAGKVSNFCGYGEEKVLAVVTTEPD